MAHELQPDGRVHGVVFGCYRPHDRRWLMVRRSRHVAVLPRRVCFPGGGVCLGEGQQAACVREAAEELAVAVRPIQAVWRHDFVDRPLTLFGWLAELDGAELVLDPLEIEEVLWLTREEAVGHPDGVETNRAFLDALEREIASHHLK
jgi:8-oxo-dGTP pyrophosphatase MutT (NUDIX family)